MNKFHTYTLVSRQGISRRERLLQRATFDEDSHTMGHDDPKNEYECPDFRSEIRKLKVLQLNESSQVKGRESKFLFLRF